jgi:zinc-binding alcohol dehydrogenase/oxidoreductase
LSWAHAAALPLAGITAFRGLMVRAALQPGERVLITGVGGGVALFAVQYALAHGAQVFATSGSDAKLERVRRMGVVGTANYKADDWPDQLRRQATGGFDVIFDSAMGPAFQHLIELAAPGGRIAFPGTTAGRKIEVDMRDIYRKQLSVLGTKMGSPRDFAAMLDFVARHRIEPIVDRVMAFSEVNDAYAVLHRAEQFGKVVLTVSE